MTENTPSITSTWVDPDDAPELDEDFFRSATPMIGDNVVSQATFKAAAPRGRPRKTEVKVAVTIRYDADIINAFGATG